MIFSLFILCISTFQLILFLILLSGDSSLWSNGSIQGSCCSSQRTDEYLGAFYLSVCKQDFCIQCLFHTVCSGMSDKHIILIASWCYYLMMPSAQATAGGDSEETGEKVTLNSVHLCRGVVRCSADTRWRQLSEFNLVQEGSEAKANGVKTFSTNISTNLKKENNTKSWLRKVTAEATSCLCQSIRSFKMYSFLWTEQINRTKICLHVTSQPSLNLLC